MKGQHVHRGFMLIEPENELGKQLELLARLDDDEHVARYRAFENWHKHTQDIAGPFYLWTVEHLFRDNELIRGELRVGGERVDLRRISMPVNLLAGAKDRITPPGQVFALADAVATHPADVVQHTDRRRSPRPVHGPRGAARALAPDPRRRARAVALVTARDDPAAPAGPSTRPHTALREPITRNRGSGRRDDLRAPPRASALPRHSSPAAYRGATARRAPRIPPMSLVDKQHASEGESLSADGLTDIGPASTIAGLDDDEFAVLRQVGGHWSQALGGRQAWVRALPIDPGLHRFPSAPEPGVVAASRRSTSSGPRTLQRSWPRLHAGAGTSWSGARHRPGGGRHWVRR